MIDTRDEEKDRNKIKGVLQDTQDPRTNCKIYDTGNMLNSIMPVLYQSTVYCNMHAYIMSKLHTETVPAQHNTRHKANGRQIDGR